MVPLLRRGCLSVSALYFDVASVISAESLAALDPKHGEPYVVLHRDFNAPYVGLRTVIGIPTVHSEMTLLKERLLLFWPGTHKEGLFNGNAADRQWTSVQSKDYGRHTNPSDCRGIADNSRALERSESKRCLGDYRPRIAPTRVY